MNIQLEQPEWTLESPVMVEKLSCTLVMDLLTMKGETKREVRHMSIAVRYMSIATVNDRDSLPEKPTLLDLIHLMLKRLHPALQYVAEQNGIKVFYHERWALHQALDHIEYGPDGTAKRIVL